MYWRCYVISALTTGRWTLIPRCAAAPGLAAAAAGGCGDGAGGWWVGVEAGSMAQ